MDDQPDLTPVGYCEPSEDDNFLTRYVRTASCGAKELLDASFGRIFDTAQAGIATAGTAVTDVATTAGETAQGVASSGAGAAADIAESAAGGVKAVANPWNAVALGGGLSAGLVVPLALGGVVVADWLLNGGRITKGLVRGVSSVVSAIV